MKNLSPFCALAVAFLFVSASRAEAQQGISVPLDQGFEVRVPAFPTGEERTRQPDLWMLDVDLKPMRLRTVAVTDPVTGDVQREIVWYLVYRVFNRPVRAAAAAGSVDPVNELDTPYTRPLFQPRVTLVTYDDPTDEIPNQTVVGDVHPQIVQRLREIEQRVAGTKIEGAVEVIQSLPQPADDTKPIYGIALFRNVDPETDFFKVTFRGLTNAYEIRDDAEGKRVWRKVLTQRFKRPGDGLDPTQTEFNFDGEPVWQYVPSDVITDPDIIAANADSVSPAAE